MNRFILFSLMLLTSTLSFAQKEHIKVKSGNPKVLMQKGKYLRVEFDYTDLMIEGEPAQKYLSERGQDHVRDFPNDNHVAEGWFEDRWNEESDKYLRIIKLGNPDYTMKIHIKEMDLGNLAAAMWTFSRKAGGIIISGTVSVADANGQEVVAFEFDDYKGNSTRGLDFKSPNDGRRRAVGYKSFCKDLLSVIEESK